MWKVSSITPTAGIADALDDFQRVAGGAADIGLEAVQRLHAEQDAGVGGAPPGRDQAADHGVDATAAFVGVDGCGSAPGEDERGAVERAADDASAERLGDLDRLLEIGHAGVVGGRVGTRQVARQVHAGSQHAGEPGVGDRRARLRKVEFAGLGHQQFDDVRPCPLHAGKGREMLAGEGPRIEHRDDADRVRHGQPSLRRRSTPR